MPVTRILDFGRRSSKSIGKSLRRATGHVRRIARPKPAKPVDLTKHAGYRGVF
jgi:hypothetical protein